MTIETVMGSTGRQSNDWTGGFAPRARSSGGARGETNGVPELAMAHRLGRYGRSAAQLAAQLAHNSLLALVDVYALTYERGALAVFAAMAVRRERSDATPQQEALQLLDV